MVLTILPQNILVKNIITRNFNLLRDDPDTASIFQPLRILCAYRRDINLRDSLVRSTLNGTTATNEDRGTFPCALLHATPACTRTHRPLLIPPEDALWSNLSVSVSAKTWFMPSNAIPEYIGETGRRLGDRFREHLRSTRLTDTDFPVGRHFASPGHTAEDMLVSVIRSGFSSTTHRRSVEARMIFKHLRHCTQEA